MQFSLNYIDRHFKKLSGLLLFLFIGIGTQGFCQSAKDPDTSQKAIVIINKIIIDGNKITKASIIERQFTFHVGDTVPINTLMDRMNQTRQLLMNIGLFNEVVINIKNWTDPFIDIEVTVSERWYTFPLPTFNLYDRNFNVWWVTHDHSLKWVQYGVHFIQHNMRGRDESLELTALFGFSQLFQFDYDVPFFDKKQENGFHFTASFSQGRNIAYEDSLNHDLIFQNIDGFQHRTFNVGLNYVHQPGFHNRYIFSLAYTYNSINDTIAVLNPDYFLNGETVQYFLSFRAEWQRDYRDYFAYPLRGSFTDVTFTKLGLGFLSTVDYWAGSASYDKYMPIGGKWYSAVETKVKYTFPQNQPYNFQHGLGYKSDYVNGYEYYVIDGQGFGSARFSISNEFLKLNIKTFNNPFFQNNKLPFAIFGRIFTSIGYVKDEMNEMQNPLANQLLIGYGVGLDIRFVYDTVLRFEYSFNKMGEHGLFFHVSSYF